MCKSPKGIFFVPIVTGTIEGPIETYIRGSMHPQIFLPLPLLSDDSSIKISRAITRDDDYITHNPYFRCCIGDIGGHVRTLEFFLEKFSEEMKFKAAAEVEVKKLYLMLCLKFGITIY